MVWIDGVLLAIIGISFVIGVIRGLVSEALSLATWILAFWLSFVFAEPAATFMEPYITPVNLRVFVTFASLFVSLMFIGAIINHLISKFVRAAPFSGTDRALGGVFGIARGAIFGLAITFITGLTEIPQSQSWSEAVLVQHFETIAERLRGHLPANLSEGFNKLALASY